MITISLEPCVPKTALLENMETKPVENVKIVTKTVPHVTNKMMMTVNLVMLEDSYLTTNATQNAQMEDMETVPLDFAKFVMLHVPLVLED